MRDRPTPSAPPIRLPQATAAQNRMLALAMLGLWTLVTIYLQWDVWSEDLSAVYIAGYLWQQGQPELIYAAPPGFFGGTSADWLPVQRQLGLDELNSFPFVYPPLWAVLAGPVTAYLSPQGLANAVTCLQVPMLAASVWLALRILPAPGWPLWLQAGIGVLLLSTMIPAYSALWFNNPSITVNFLVLLAFERLTAGRPATAGAALALAAAIKLTPAAFVLILVFDRQWRAVAGFALVGGALGLGSLILAGLPLHGEFLASLRAVSDAVLLSPGNISLRGAYMALAAALGVAPPIDPAQMNVILLAFPAWLDPALALTAAALIVAFGRRLRHQPPALRRGAGLLALAIIIPLFGPLGWLHYYVLPMLLLPGLLALRTRRPTIPTLVLLALASLSVTFAAINALPWPSANYVWLMSALWLATLACLYAGLARLPPLRPG